ncbi:DUF618-domain-containing protein [Trematosphaeria pertusa]|uniref:DUF618-domain-containing protein n=1 Tax=Trematosphaeria pertusa TaxID=390896 RepID=A0A6A6IQ94_9PLEO|nr:DUF618-domain-containing protein [Trematosphaeria pertusa]KAF2251740.1 DUF618-domain-containing protein [Trematosphaeria pertusa]
MAFTEDSLRAKLSSLNETQDSISTVGQWILFHRRHADKIAQLWSQRVKESPPNKKLTLVYLANEIVQQSKIRRKDEFLKAYDPLIAEGTSAAYKGSNPDIQNKIRRVVEVWRQRQVFRLPIQEEVERSLDEIDRSRSNRKPALGGSLFSNSSVPPELTSVAPLATSLQKADLTAKPAIATANQDYEKLTNPNNAIPTPPMHAAGLAALVKKLAVAEGAVAESIKARQALVDGLEKLLEENKIKLGKEEAQLADLRTRKDAIESRKREVEDAILRGLSAAETNKISAAPLPGLSQAEPDRPNVEELTPPPMESFTPVGSPRPDIPDVPDDVYRAPPANPMEPVAAEAPPEASAVSAPATAIGPVNEAAGADLLRALQHARPDEHNGVYGQGTYKKRKMSRSAAEDEFAAFAGDLDMNGIESTLDKMI